ncbi:MAG: hypothetical protein WCW44_04755 [archaeon]|jgi:hypothetical protein
MKSKKISPFALRRLGTVLSTTNTGLALRSTSVNEVFRARRKGSIVHPKGSVYPTYVWQAPALKDIQSARTVIRQLRTTLIETVQRQGQRIKNWRNWKSSTEYPCIVLLGKNPKYRGGDDSASTYHFKRGKGIVGLTGGFPKTTYFSGQIKSKDIIAVIRPTKREMQKCEENAKKYCNPNDIVGWGFHVSDQFARLMMTKTTKKLLQVYSEEIESSKKVSEIK